MHSQRMASIMPIVIGCIDYLAYGTIFTRAIFRPNIKLDVFFPARKAVDERWGVVRLIPLAPPTLSHHQTTSCSNFTTTITIPYLSI